MRSNNKQVLASTARTATSATDVPIPAHAVGLHIIIDVTAIAATPSVVPTIQFFDAISQKAYTVLTGAAITGTGTTVLKIGPDIASVTNIALQDYVPEMIRVTMTHADTDSITYSVATKIFG